MKLTKERPKNGIVQVAQKWSRFLTKFWRLFFIVNSARYNRSRADAKPINIIRGVGFGKKIFFKKENDLL
jgi:hypothetical protein